MRVIRRVTSHLASWLNRVWYQPRLHPSLVPLLPLSALVCTIARRRYRRFTQSLPPAPLPVIVVGNISVGGTGKTPLVRALVERLQAQGYRPAIISRGYGSKSRSSPLQVTAHSTASECGDEPLLLARLTGVPVVVDQDRQRALQMLYEQRQCDVVVSDDGLQHYRLPRTLELAVVDGLRGLGNGYCLPAGPLRESAQRLHKVDYVVCNGAGNNSAHPGAATGQEIDNIPMQIEPVRFVSVADHATSRPLTWNWQQSVHAVAGIGHPERFFTTLEALGLSVIRHAFADHHAFVADDLSFSDRHAIIMTAKDATKCSGFAGKNWWYLDVDATLPETFWHDLFLRLEPVGR